MSRKNLTEFVALYDYAGQSGKDLSFSKHDTLWLREKGHDPNWWTAEDANGRIGFIPSNYVKEKHTALKVAAVDATGSASELCNPYPWFHGKISRQVAESLMTEHMMRDGLFLLRESTNFPGDYTLCVCADGSVQHYRVETVDGGKLTVDQESFFDDMTALVEHYRMDDDGLVSRLLTPILVTGAQPVIDRKVFKKAGWEMDRSEVQLGKILGSGNFGDVCEGTWRGKTVAVKTLKGNDQLAAAFLAEASVMTRLMHPNLVQLLGVCTDAAPIYIVTEFMSKGCMLDYLRSRGRSVITQPVLLNFCVQICHGMAFLEEKLFVHRDLAARNVLVGENNVCKVADFGLATSATDLSGIDSSQIPIKWTAPEAIKENIYTNKSDVWSFGVTAWELYSFGRTPYPRMQHNEVVQRVRDGFRMAAPDDCPPDVYDIIRLCWTADPAQRPSFASLVASLESLL